MSRKKRKEEKEGKVEVNVFNIGMPGRKRGK